MGSIVNAGHKSWNTKYIPYQALINEYDRRFYEIIRKNNLSLPEYQNIIGSSMTKELGVDNISINVPDEMEEKNINIILDELNKRLNPSLKIKYLKYKNKYLKMKHYKKV
jgi:hypothetical protein